MSDRSSTHQATWPGRVAGAGIAALLALATALPAQTTPSGAPAVDTQAVNALRRMGAYLRTLQRFSVQATATRDEVTAGGQKVNLDGTLTYQVRRPNGLRVDLMSDRKQRQLIYDGRTVTLFAPRMNYYASSPAPSTIGALVDTVQQHFGIELPLADLFRWGTENDGTRDLTAAWFVGPAHVEGVDTDQYAFRQEGTDWQVWIERGARPLPRKIVITTTTEPSQPQYIARLTWNTSPTFADSVFAFTPPPSAHKIRLTPAENVFAITPSDTLRDR